MPSPAYNVPYDVAVVENVNDFGAFNTLLDELPDARNLSADIGLFRPWLPPLMLSEPELLAELEITSRLAARMAARRRWTSAQQYLDRGEEIEAELKARP